MDMVSNSDASQVTTTQRLPLAGSRELNFTNSKFASGKLKGFSLDAEVEDYFSQTAEGGIYDYNWTARATLHIPATLQYYVGMPASITVLWTTSHNYPHDSSHATTYEIDVGKTLTNAVLAWSTHYYSSSRYWSYYVFRVVGILTLPLGVIRVMISGQDTYGDDSKDPPRYENTINTTLSVDDVGLRAILPPSGWQASDEPELPFECCCAGRESPFDVIITGSPTLSDF